MFFQNMTMVNKKKKNLSASLLSTSFWGIDVDGNKNIPMQRLRPRTVRKFLKDPGDNDSFHSVGSSVIHPKKRKHSINTGKRKNYDSEYSSSSYSVCNSDGSDDPDEGGDESNLKKEKDLSKTRNGLDHQVSGENHRSSDEDDEKDVNEKSAVVEIITMKNTLGNDATIPQPYKEFMSLPCTQREGTATVKASILKAIFLLFAPFFPTFVACALRC